MILGLLKMLLKRRLMKKRDNIKKELEELEKLEEIDIKGGE